MFFISFEGLGFTGGFEDQMSLFIVVFHEKDEMILFPGEREADL